MKKLNYSLLVILFFFLNFETLNSQEKASKEKKANSDSFISRVGVVDMKRILNQSKAYQSLVDQFEDKRRKQRNIITKQEDQIRDQESELIKQKNVLSKEVYAEKVKSLNKKINEIKEKNMAEAKKFEALFERSTNKIQGALVDVLSVIANDANLNIVLAKSQVILVGKDIDLTEKAVVELNKVLPKVTLGEN
ncbi:MAG: hypothetical protein CMP34_01215 [Rickettsiales bacterium]|nr:hypothetical protein [Rickettsiales bacterium]|tara:strand:- start:4453 stop:5031 length:579 start_codon:yes stop_codon:yes gene_type:complete